VERAATGKLYPLHKSHRVFWERGFEQSARIMLVRGPLGLARCCIYGVREQPPAGPARSEPTWTPRLFRLQRQRPPGWTAQPSPLLAAGLRGRPRARGQVAVDCQGLLASVILFSVLAGSWRRYNKSSVLIAAKWLVVPMSVSFMSTYLPGRAALLGLHPGRFPDGVRSASLSPGKWSSSGRSSGPTGWCARQRHLRC